MKFFLLGLISAITLFAASGHQSAAATSAVQTSNVCAPNPDPATPDFTQVDTPSAGDSVSSPVTVRGRINAFEATFKVTVFGAGGNTIADVTAMSSQGQVLAPFETQVSFSVAQQTSACMWVYENSARDGSPVHVVQIPLSLRATPGGVPQTGGGAAVGGEGWPFVLAGILLAVSGATLAVAAARRN